MSQYIRKSGTNSALRKAQQERQENRRFTIFGSVLAVALLAIFVFSGNDNSVESAPADLTVETADTANDATVNALQAYGRGVPPMEEIDAMIEGPAN